MPKTARRVLSVMAALALIFAMTLGVLGDTAVPAVKVIRVGFPLQDGFAMKDSDGNYSGYTYDYLQEIAQYTGWEYEFVEVPGDINESLSSLLDMLSKGEIDIMGSMVKNDQTQEQYDFPEYGYGFNYSTLVTCEENTAINENNYATVKGLRVAVYKNGSVGKTKLQTFLELNNIEYTFVPCEQEEDLIAAVREGRADVMISNDVNPMEGFRTVAQFSGSQFYFGLAKGNTELLNQLNSTILTIQKVKPYFDSSLHEKYFASRSGRVYLTDAEQEYIDTARPLKVVMLRSIPPIQFYDEKDELHGIAKDVLERIKSDTGLEFEYVSAKDYSEAYQMLGSGEADAICGIPYDYDLAQAHDLVMSTPFLSTQSVLAVKDGNNEDLSGKTVGVVKNYSKPSSLKETVFFDNIEDCMQAVLSGSIDGAYINLYSAEYLTHYTQYKGLRLIPQTGETSDFCFGIKKPLNVTVVSIINKVLSNIPASELEAITYQNTITGGSLFTLSDFIYNNPFLFVGILSGLFIVLVLIGLWIMHIRIKAGKRLNVENQRYLQLCELANEYIYEYNVRQDTLVFSKQFSKLFMLPDKVPDFTAVANGSAEPMLNHDICAILTEIISAADENDIERLCALPDGEHRWFRCTRAEIKDDDGRLTYIIGKLTDIQTEKEAKDQMEKQILLDGLTGIYNAVSSKKIIREKLHTLSAPGAMLIIDIDYFKNVNDRLGHYIGDAVLKDFAHMIYGSIGKQDIAGRLGGDEFIVFMNGDHDAVQAFCGRLCEQARREYSGGDGAKLQITVSIGAAVVTKKCGFTELYKVADKELYISKNNGRDRFTVIDYDSEAEL